MRTALTSRLVPDVILLISQFLFVMPSQSAASRRKELPSAVEICLSERPTFEQGRKLAGDK